MKVGTVLKGVFVVGVVVFVLMFSGKVWNFLFPVKPPVVNPGGNNPVVSVTPTHVTPNVQHQIPGGQHGVTQIDVPPVHNNPGVIENQHVVVTDQGNTLVVTTEKIDWGFRLEPKVFLGYSDTVFLGLGANIFTFWRVNTDVLIASNIAHEQAFSKFYLGAGLSYQVYKNTFLGINVLESTEAKTTYGASLNLKF